MSALAFARQKSFAPTVKRAPDGVRILRIVVVGVGLHRAITLTTVLAGDAGITSASMAAAYLVVVVWSCLLVWDAWRRGMFRRRLAAADVALATAVGLLALTWGSPGMSFGYGVLQGAAIVAGCAFPPRAVPVAVGALVGVKLLAVVTPGPGRITVTEFAAYASTLAALAVAAAVAHRLLRLAADALDRRQATAVDLAGEQAEHRRMLHDTALATLTAIANGVLDTQADEVRARCARDAARLRLLVQGGQVSPGSLTAALAAAAEDAAALGLTVRPICGQLPMDLDPGVMTAIAMAAREALNNVHDHADADEAWLSAASEAGRVVVRVVDHGVGFTRTPLPHGSGIRDSIIARMNAVGGAATVESAPGEGTCVELRWPR